MEGWLVVLLLVTLLQLADLRTDLNLVLEEGGGGRFEQLRLVMDSARQMGDHPHHNCCSILSCFGLHNNLIHFSNRVQLFQRYMDRNLLKIIGT